MTGDRRWFILAAGAVLTAGCQSVWIKPPSAASLLPQAGMSPDSVVLEICTLRYQETDAALVAEVWAACDESSLTNELRRELAENGFRAGILGQRTPPALEKLLAAAAPPKPSEPQSENATEQAPAKSEAENQAEVRPEKLGRAEHRRIHSRLGQRVEVLSSDVRPKIAVLKRVEGKLTGREFREAQCVLALNSQPLGDARVRIDITPEVHHGAAKQRFVGQQGVFTLDHGRDREVFGDLRIATLLGPGQTLLVATPPDALGLGREFFLDSAARPPEAKLLLIRVAQTQYDDLFAPERVVTPVATLE